jgi:hypothetical protein
MEHGESYPRFSHESKAQPMCHPSGLRLYSGLAVEAESAERGARREKFMNLDKVESNAN